MSVPESLRALAVKCRWLAANINDDQTREQLLKLAADYDQRATELGQPEQPNPMPDAE